ncbi:hypothetical protein [Paenibacillus nasutitermitis]|uniref:Flagellar hook-associated protein 2 C-terminal domain-containing protein n=1 Tax=Paenibacillus nasutitermitis TaxID=1652958 RepID=A0A917E491_9BACL|nr:hypothetical protein [Paenibacillus nasutitermitis]GGE01582.1 hypothetical protein GCM10010911_70620 [Paenibacillus nasutitermitis]
MIRSIAPVSRSTFYPVQPVLSAEQYPFTYEEDRSPLNRGGSYNNNRSFHIPSSAKKTMDHAADYAASWLRQSYELRAAANTLANKSTSAFEKRSIQSSQAGIVSGEATSEASRTGYEIQALALAQPQRNAGYDFAASAPSIVSAGKHSFIVDVDGHQRIVSVSVGTSDSNAVSLGKIRDAINSAKLGITVIVNEDNAAGTTRLEAIADKTGPEQSFSLSDLGGSLIAATGIGNVLVSGTNAVYRLNNGPALSSPNNEIMLEDGKASLQLLETTRTPVKVTVGYNADAITEQLSVLLGQANKLNAAYSHASDYLNESLKQNVDQAFRSSAWIGITQSDSGEWRLDAERLKSAITRQPEEVRTTVAGLDGIAPRLVKSLARFEQLPADALLSTSSDELQSFMAYQSSMQSYLQLQMNGVLVNSMI